MRYFLLQVVMLGGLAGMAMSCGADDARDSEPLFDASARAYGFPFEAHIWEHRRLPAVSIMREQGAGHGGALGHSMFRVGCLGELCHSRGFTHLLILQEGPLTSSGARGDRVWETVVGFTHTPEPDVAAEFPAFYVPGDEYATTAASLAADALGGWPPGSLSEPDHALDAQEVQDGQAPSPPLQTDRAASDR